ncbi:hypothetical protein GX50_04578 [[Emmonsia] crescens]|uniref:Uncharacterized protein n=1 Tax=[Emmonsia] crescens TaxID=73230 RepID=A0A2B7Z869_9EURO|nr:hypothetical protein GX50_04578 [Emmonsia crescens]
MAWWRIPTSNRGVPTTKRVDASSGVIERQRIQLTEEDNARIKRKTDKAILTVLVWIYFLQVGTLYSISLGSRQGRSRHRVAVRSPRRHQYAWKPILLGGLDIANCTAGMAALFHMVDRASAPPNPAADVGAWVGYFSSMHGRLQRFRLPTRWPVLPGPLRSRLSSPFQRNYESMVPSCRAAYSSGYLVFNKRGCNYHGVGAGIWFEPYSIRYPEALADVSFNSLSIFLFTGLVTIVSSLWAYWKLDNNISSARFLTESERQQAIERLRANKTVLASINFGRHFGTSRLALSRQIVILASCWAAHQAKLKSMILAAFMIPVIVGATMLYMLDREPSDRAPLVVAYYLLACLFSGNPLIVSWIIGNTAGTTKQSMNMALYQAGSSVGNIVGPLLFHEKNAPIYHPGLRVVLGVFVAMIVSVGIQVVNLMMLNELQIKKRVKHGKQAAVEDKSMKKTYHSFESGKDAIDDAGMLLGQQAFLDLTDQQNDEFVYIY